MKSIGETRDWQMACQEKALSIAEMLITKQHDYGKANITDFGELGILVRSNDKIARLKNLSKNKANPKNESKRDSWADLAGYSILALMLIDEEFDLPFTEFAIVDKVEELEEV